MLACYLSRTTVVEQACLIFIHASLQTIKQACSKARRVCVARFCISQHPDVEACLVAELDDNCLLAKPGQPKPRAVSHDDLAKLTYLGRVIKVARRLACHESA